MASLTEAERAREQKSEYLRKLGAHAIGVEQVGAPEGKPRKKKQGDEFAVVAYFEREPKRPLPEALEVKAGKKKSKVPLTLKVAPKFRLE